MKTKADLRQTILTSLTVIDPEVTPSNEQAQTLDLYIDSARAGLLEDGLCWWDANAIPDAILIPLSRYVMALCCGAFGRAGKGYEAGEDPARRRIAALKPTARREDVPVDYF